MSALWSIIAFSITQTAVAQFGGPTSVVVAPVVERDILPTVRLVGTVLPDKRAIVAAETSGALIEFKATEGQQLKRGEIIAVIDPAVAQFRVDEAKALLGGYEAKLAELEAGTREEQLRRQKATVEEARAMHEKWKAERERIRSLAERSQANEKERNDTEMEYIAAERRLAQTTAELDMWTNGPRKEEIAKARQDVASQKAVVGRVERDLAKTAIIAPFDGFVVTKRSEVGEWVIAGGPVCEVVAMDVVKIRADAPEAAVPFARVGAPASVEFESLKRSVSAKVSRLVPLATASARTFPIEIDVPNPDFHYLPGMFVWVAAPAGEPGKRLMVPKDAINMSGLAKQIYVIRDPPPQPAAPPGSAPPDGPPGGAPAGPPGGAPPGPPPKMAMPLSVTTGLELGGEIEVVAQGLAAGDKVVIRANERLMGPSPVIVMEAAAAHAKKE